MKRDKLESGLCYADKKLSITHHSKAHLTAIEYPSLQPKDSRSATTTAMKPHLLQRTGGPGIVLSAVGSSTSPVRTPSVCQHFSCAKPPLASSRPDIRSGDDELMLMGRAPCPLRPSRVHRLRALELLRNTPSSSFARSDSLPLWTV